ncbi:MAG TPA: hypothetical protein DCX53_12800 [Anaerolineae bacterium]|nr:hypothetical protein [Anaerolineae bacterium]
MSKNQSRSSAQLWNLLSIFILVFTACIAGYFVLIFLNPNSSLNILPPGGSLFAPDPPTATPEPIKLQPTWTASPTLEMTPTDTPRPTFTPLFTDTPFSLVPPTRTPKPTNTPKAPFTAISVTQVASTLIHPEFECNWAGIGGTVVDENNSPVIGTVVVLRGFLSGSSVEQQNLSGINKEYGSSGFEFVIGNAPIASNKTLYVQLVDLNNIPLSAKVELTTSVDCSKNLILVRFKKNR